MNVTDQILESHRIYGASDNTSKAGLSSSRSLNYASGASIQRPEQEKVTTIPRTMTYQDSVGLFGAENHFVKVNVLIQNPILGDFVVEEKEEIFKPALISNDITDPDDPYTYPNTGSDEPGTAFINYNIDNSVVNTFNPAFFSGETIANINSKFFKVELINLKTGNIYVDNWLDVRLYNKYHEEHPYPVMYIKYNEPFYIGFHARNTRRLPYNVDCVLGKSDTSPFPALLELDEVDPRLLATKR